MAMSSLAISKPMHDATRRKAMKHYDLCKTDRTPNVIRDYTLNAMKECGMGDTVIRDYANIDVNSQRFRDLTVQLLDYCNQFYEQNVEREKKDAQHRQTATYKQFTCLMDIRYLMSRCVDEKAYKELKKAMKIINSINPEAFAEDKDGNIIRELIPACRPHWKKD